MADGSEITQKTDHESSRETDIEFHLAEYFEALAEAIPDRTALIVEGQKKTYTDLDKLANQVGHFFTKHGVAKNDHVALYLLNSVEHVTAIIGLLKISAPSINVNYRYTGPELKHILNDSDSVAVLVDEPEHQEILASILPDLTKLRTVMVVGYSATDVLCEAAKAADVALVHFADYIHESDEMDFTGRSGDDIFVMYTGGTTGYPKGVMWRHHDFFMKPLSGGNAYGDARRNYEDVKSGAADFPEMINVNCAPLIHGAAMFSLFTFFGMGGSTILMRQFDAEKAVRLVAEHSAQVMVIVGDGMGSPIADYMEELKDEIDMSSLFSISSGGAVWSNGVRERMLAVKPDLYLRDSFGASESGNDGEFAIDANGNLTMPSSQHITVLGLDNEPLEPGSDEIGMIARIGHVPLGYYNDPDKTERTFVTLSDGRRASILGDMGRLDAEGMITFLGRGSGCINTGGEKVFPEEVEAALHAHPQVTDALVVGVPDERYGSKVGAVVALRDSNGATIENLQEHCRTMLAGYKIPKTIVFVDEVKRTPAGKANYKWAKETVEAE